MSLPLHSGPKLRMRLHGASQPVPRPKPSVRAIKTSIGALLALSSKEIRDLQIVQNIDRAGAPQGERPPLPEGLTRFRIQVWRLTREIATKLRPVDEVRYVIW